MNAGLFHIRLTWSLLSDAVLIEVLNSSERAQFLYKSWVQRASDHSLTPLQLALIMLVSAMAGFVV
jgi:hypothetical protein